MTLKDLWKIAREAYEKGFWKPDLEMYPKNNEIYWSHAFDEIDKAHAIAPAFKRRIVGWEHLVQCAIDMYYHQKHGNDILRRALDRLKKDLPAADDKKWLETEAFLKKFGIESLKQNIKAGFENYYVGELEISDLEAFLVFFADKMMPFFNEKERHFIQMYDTVGNALSDFANTARSIQSSFGKDQISENDLKTFLPLSEAFKEKKNTLLKAASVPHPLYEKTAFDYNGEVDGFVKRIEACEYIKKLDAVRRASIFLRFKPKDLSQTPNDFDIFGLDKKQLKFSNPFDDPQYEEEAVKPLVQDAVKPYTAAFKVVHRKVGDVVEKWIRNALYKVNEASINAWYPHMKFDPEPVMKQFNETVFKCDIENEIFRTIPKTDKLQSRFKDLSKQEGIDSNGVEKSIAEACNARFENTVMKYYQPLVTTLQTLLSHYLSLVKTIRQIEAREISMPLEKAKEHVALWLTKRDEYQQAFTVAEAKFYNASFGGKKKANDGGYQETFNDDLKKIECFKILMHRLKKWKLLDNQQPQAEKKDEAPKEQEVVDEDKKVESQPQKATVEEEDEKEDQKVSEPQQSNVFDIDASSRPTRTRRGNPSNNK